MNAREIVKALGGDWYGYYGTAPGPGHSARDRSLHISENPNGEPTVYSYAGDDWKAIKDDWRAQGLLPEFIPRERRMKAFQFVKPKNAYDSPPKQRWSDYAESLWQSCQPIADAAAQYLAARRCVIPPADGDLRWYPGSWDQWVDVSGDAGLSCLQHRLNELRTGIRIEIAPDGLY